MPNLPQLLLEISVVSVLLVLIVWAIRRVALAAAQDAQAHRARSRVPRDVAEAIKSSKMDSKHDHLNSLLDE